MFLLLLFVIFVLISACSFFLETNLMFYTPHPFYIHMCVCVSTHMHMCVGGGYIHIQVSKEGRRVHGFLRARVTGVCELPNRGCWDLNSDPRK